MRKIKQLEWHSQCTPLGEESEMVRLKAITFDLTISYFIGGDAGKLYFNTGWDPQVEVSSVEEGKRLAQKHFEKYVMDTFFEKQVPLREIYYIIYDKNTFKIFDVPKLRPKNTDDVLKNNQNLECINITHPIHKELLAKINQINNTDYK